MLKTTCLSSAIFTCYGTDKGINCESFTTRRVENCLLVNSWTEHLNFFLQNFNTNFPSPYAIRWCNILPKSSTLRVGCNSVTDNRQRDGFAMTYDEFRLKSSGGHSKMWPPLLFRWHSSYVIGNSLQIRPSVCCLSSVVTGPRAGDTVLGERGSEPTSPSWGVWGNAVSSPRAFEVFYCSRNTYKQPQTSDGACKRRWAPVEKFNLNNWPLEIKFLTIFSLQNSNPAT